MNRVGRTLLSAAVEFDFRDSESYESHPDDQPENTCGFQP